MSVSKYVSVKRKKTYLPTALHFFGQLPYYRSHLWQTVVCLSVTFCIVKDEIGNQGQNVAFLGRRHISTSGFASTATETAVVRNVLLEWGARDQ